MTMNQASRGDSRRVLLVDDNDDSAELLAELLGRAGDLEVTTASSGAQALQLAAAILPHVVVLDLGLPDMDGCDVVAKLKATPGLRDARYIALTGRSSQEDLERSQAAGFDHHFVKPPDLQALHSAVRGA